MNEEKLEAMLTETQRLAEDNNRMLRELRRWWQISFWSKLVLWGLVIILPFILIGPIISALLSYAGGSAGTGLPPVELMEEAFRAYLGEGL